MKQFSKELGKVSITPKGDWNSSITNEKLDIVYDRRNNQAYIAKQDVPIGVDIDNREYWQPLNVSGYADNNFINLTAENENGTITAYESLEEAVATIFPINRRVGATLSFYNLNSDRLDRQAEFELWQFNSTDLANWENKDYWNNIYYNWNVFAGWYIDADALNNHVETPNVGQYAYVGSNLNDALLYQCRTNGTWTNTGIKVRNYISVVVSGNITIGENGNWFSDGEDTGIPATPAVDEQIDNIITKHESLSRTVQGIAATGGASTATNVTYNNDTSRLNAENAQDAIDELAAKNATKAEKAEVTAELEKKFDKESILQESGEAEDKVMSQKAITTAIADETTRAKAAEKTNAETITNEVARLDEKIDDKTNEINVAKEEALQAIAENEQSAIANFNTQRVTPEMLSESTKQLIETSGGGTITNLADDEDLTSVDDGTGSNVLKFANRLYNTENFSGKGYKILRKNIVDGKNILKPSEILSNNINEIRYDFDLNGATIYLRENTILKFNGGKLSNGKIIFYQDSLVIDPNFENITFSQVANDVLPYSIGKVFTSETNLKNTTSVRLRDIVYLKTLYGIKPYEINITGTYPNVGGIVIEKLNNISAFPLMKNVNKGIFNVTDYGIYPNGKDMSDKLNVFLSSAMKYVANLSTLYFPGGTYKFTKPINVVFRCNIIGDDVSVYGNEQIGTVFDFSDITNDSEDELWCITANQQIYKIENIAFISNSYSLSENRNTLLNTFNDPWTEVINQENICCINCAGYINKCYFKGWSGKCIEGYYMNITNSYFTSSNICIFCKTDSTIDNIRSIGCNNIINASALTTISNIRGDSIRGEALILNSSCILNNVVIDWGYKSVYSIQGSNSAGLSTYSGYNYNVNTYRNVINPALINKKTLDNVDVTYDMGIISIKRINGIKAFNCNITIQGIFLSNIKDGSINYESDKITTITIPLTIDIETLINLSGIVNITLFDINIDDVISNVSLVKNFIYVISGEVTGEVILNNRHFYFKNLDKDHYDKEHIIYLGDNKLPCSGDTEKRPVNVNVGFQYFDTTLKKPLWWTGTEWVDSNGTSYAGV